MLVINIVGARPNFMKIAPIIRAMDRAGVPQFLVHTGQHYDEAMSDLFFRQLAIPKPDLNLEVGSASQAQQTAEIMRRFEPVVLEYKPDMVLVVGDVNSTMACALVAVKLGIRVAHVEAGLRSFDRAMPEEINRLVTDAVSDLLFVSERSGMVNLKREGIPDERIHFVGNVMIDTLLTHRARAAQSDILSRLELGGGQEYALVTMHRPSNVDDPEKLRALVSALNELARDVTVVFPIHPRTRRNVEAAGLSETAKIRLIDPLGYLDFLNLMDHSRVVITDSGGIQEETTVLGVPCLTVRDNTERPVTIECGTNRLVGSDPQAMLAAAREVLRKPVKRSERMPELWDGKAAERIVQILQSELQPSEAATQT